MGAPLPNGNPRRHCPPSPRRLAHSSWPTRGKPPAGGRGGGNFALGMRTLAMPKTAEPWSLTSLREKLIKIGAKVVSHGRYVTFQMAEVAVSRLMFRDILMFVARLRAPLTPA
jgi:Transposase DDE domain group 1